ncbi:MAG: hypothetical protein AAF609_06615 [Cyanobacteria bacterium P01_C01_bin.120]
MSQFAFRLSETELSQRILEMAKTGVYRESVFEAFQSLATKRQIRQAIAYAKQFGLYSVRDLRDADLGTFYQVDLAKYQSFQAALEAAVPLPAGDDLAAQMLLATQTIRTMLAIASSFAVIFFIAGSLCFLTGHLQSGRFAWVSAATVGGIWLLQQRWARSHTHRR